MTKDEQQDHIEGIAIIGMACRVPGAKNIREYWENLCNGVESITFFSDAELLESGVRREVIKDPRYVPARGIIDDVDMFDAGFFGVNPREAEVMDPQQRIFLEQSWEALEDAGYNPGDCKGLVGVYAGVAPNTYALGNLLPNQRLLESIGILQAFILNDKDHLTTRISYKLNLRGPSVNIQTACSTSLVAVHFACQGLLSYQCDMAIAGGVSVSIPVRAGYMYQEGGINSPDGHCRAFDAGAQGTVGGSGCGVVILKRVGEADRDRDRVYAVIKGTAINNDGSKKVGYTAPSVGGQAEVIRMAQAVAGVEAESISYIEAHGTGTTLGDPIEIAALKEAFNKEGVKEGGCGIGSVKTNIGHLDTAAGVVGLIKTALALKNRKIPASLHYKEANERLGIEGSPFYVNERLRIWEEKGGVRRAGVSSFGIGGTNAHVIVEEAAERKEGRKGREWQMLMVSSRTERGLERQTEKLKEYLRGGEEEERLADVAYTLQVGRRRHPYRRVVICRDSREGIEAIEKWDKKRIVGGGRGGEEVPVIYMFAGQGAQRVNMCRWMYEEEEEFRRELDRCMEQVREEIGRDIREVMYPAEGREEEAREEIAKTKNTQVALYAIEYAMAKLWMSMGVTPAGMIGHSLGEYAAATIAGVMSVEEGMRLVAERGRLMEEGMREGGMLSIGAGEEEVKRMVSRGVRVAAVNGEEHVVVSGEKRGIEEMERRCKEQGIGSRRVEVERGFHSEMVEDIEGEYEEALKRVEMREPMMRYISGVTGKWIKGEEARDTKYWMRQMREEVRFWEGLKEVMRGGGVLLEVGAGETLSRIARREAKKAGVEVVASDSGRWSEEGGRLQRAIAEMWVAGARIDWEKYYKDEERMRVRVPGYEFERERFWVEGKGEESKEGKEEEERKGIEEWMYVPVWKQGVWIEGEEGVGEGRKWMLLMDEEGIGEEIGKEIEKEGIEVIKVRKGGGNKREGYTVEAGEEESYKELMKNVMGSGEAPEKIIHLWGVSGGRSEKERVTERIEDECFYSLLFLAKALGGQILSRSSKASDVTKSVEIVAITNGVHKVTGLESLCPEKALLIGPCRVIPHEYPNIECRSIDVCLSERDVNQRKKVINQLMTELKADSGERIVAHRGTQRWVQTFEPVSLGQPRRAKSRLRDQGVYLITGGLGGIGLEVAEYLAQAVKAKLVLIGRSGFPHKSEWKSSYDEVTSRKIKKLQAIEEAGAEVMLAQADVSNEVQMKGIISKTYERFGRINGIIHGAGNPGGGMTQFKTREMAADVLAPKVKGTRVLETLLHDANLDFIVLFSSLSSFIGRPGRIDYSAANAFLDSFAQCNNLGEGPFTVSINWDGWTRVGMAVDAARARGLDFEESVGEAISPEEGIEVFKRILSGNQQQVAVSVRDLNARITAGQTRTAAKSLKELEGIRQNRPAVMRPQLSKPYMAARNETEKILGEIWEELLGIDQIGVEDNFFELGGDSVISIQVLSKAASAGLHLSPEQVFQHQTISELAAVASSKSNVKAEQEVVKGPLPLTPIQKRFFEEQDVDLQHYNQAIMLAVSQSVDPRVLQAVSSRIVAHHDALRLRFERVGLEWQQRNAGIQSKTVFLEVDLSALAPAQHQEAIETAASEAQLSLNITEGPLIRVVYINLGCESRLLIVTHHLAVDAISWRLLLEDIQKAYEQAARGEENRLSEKTTSFKRWAQKLSEYSRGGDLEREASYWLGRSLEDVALLPADFVGGRNTVESESTVRQSLDEENTRLFLREVPKAYNTQVHEILISALALALKRTTGGRTILVDLEGHGREAILDDVNLSRTVGWFTSVYPVALNLDDYDLERAVKTAKEELRNIPNNGIGYGLLRYLSGNAEIEKRLREQPQSQVSFLYLGQLDRVLSESSVFAPARESTGPNRSLRQRRRYLLEIDSSVIHGCLQVSWNYSENIHRRSTVESLAGAFAQNLRAIISHCSAPGVGGYTPSDFPDAGLSQEELDDIFSRFSDSRGLRTG